MQDSDIPAKFPIPWGNNAELIRSIPTASQIGVEAGAASLHDGFVPVNGIPVAAGGVPPFEQDMNGILKQVTSWNRWHAAGGPITYDSTFQTAITGYPKSAIVQSALVPGLMWRSTVEGNVTNPDTGGAGWEDPSFLTGHGQCRLLVASPTLLLLVPHDGRRIICNGIGVSIPQAGITISNAGLAASTLYYVYAFLNAGTLTLALSTTGHTPDTSARNYPVEVKVGDGTHTLVGMVLTDAAVHFLDDLMHRHCINWFNRKAMRVNSEVGSGSTSSTVLAEIMSSAARASFCCWAGDAVQLSSVGFASSDIPGGSFQSAIGIDSTSVGSGSTSKGTSTAANDPQPAISYTLIDLTEGAHFAALLGAAEPAGTITFTIGIQAMLFG